MQGHLLPLPLQNPMFRAGRICVTDILGEGHSWGKLGGISGRHGGHRGAQGGMGGGPEGQALSNRSATELLPAHVTTSSCTLFTL